MRTDLKKKTENGSKKKLRTDSTAPPDASAFFEKKLGAIQPGFLKTQYFFIFLLYQL